MNYEQKKIKSHEFEILKQARIRESGEIVSLDTILHIEFMDDTSVSVQFDYKKVADGYIKREYERTNSYRQEQSEMKF